MNHVSPATTGNPGDSAPAVRFSGITVTTPEAVPTPRRAGPPADQLPAPTAYVPDDPHAVADTFDASVFTHVDRAVRDWRLPTLTFGFDVLSPGAEGLPLFDPEGNSIAFRGTLLGMSTTKRTTHICDYPRAYASRTVRCGLCRWFETRIFRLVDECVESLQGMRYVLHYVGRTIVPGEVNLPRYELVRSGHEVVEAYTVRKEGQSPFITKPGAKVLAQAAYADEEIEDAYVNRATA